MTRLKYYIVDVFAQEKFTGNQVAVVEVEQPLDAETMLKIAHEMDFQETSFVSSEPDEDGHYHVRIFTPYKEVSFPGAPTLGTAFVINHFLSNGNQKQISLKLQSGILSINRITSDSNRSDFISKNKTILLSDQKQPSFGREFEPVLLSRVLGIEPAEIDDRFPIQEVFSGIGYILVPIKSLDIVKNIHINQERHGWLVQRADAKLVLAFCKETVDSQNDIHTRVFADYYNIPEDAASGSGAGSLAAYCSKYHYFSPDKVELRIEQGYEIGRPSLLIAKSRIENDKIEVNVGGRVILTAQGEILL